MNKNIGVYICQCGSNISDVVDVEKVREVIEKLEPVALSKIMMFACADSGQNEMTDDIKKHHLDAIVVASCSPKLHLYTFRAVAERAGLNYNQYEQVNIRKQGSWAHGDKPEGATDKAIRLIRMGISKVRFAEPLQPLEIESEKAVLVVGAGVSGMRSAIELSDMGLYVYLIEKSDKPGGHVSGWSEVYMNGQKGKEIIDRLNEEIRNRENINLFTGAKLTAKSGSIGNFEVEIKVNGVAEKNPGDTKKEDILRMKAGAILLTTGFEDYEPKQAAYGYGLSERVITLPEFKKLVENTDSEKLEWKGRQIRNIAYIYCVGSRQEEGNTYCSRYCCTSTIHTAIEAIRKFPDINNFHYNRGIRTYGKQEILYHQSSENGDTYIQFNEENPVTVEMNGEEITVRVNDLLTEGMEMELGADMVVLVTAMVPRINKELEDILKVPVGRDRFYNEVHPKLRPVETVLDGIYIAGCCQGPKNITESIKSSLLAASKVSALLSGEYIKLDPVIARIKKDACVWCEACAQACPFDAIQKVRLNGKFIAAVEEANCKGCGMCMPVCEPNAIVLVGYSDIEMETMIEALIE